jgi:hypothetical protein
MGMEWIVVSGWVGGVHGGSGGVVVGIMFLVLGSLKKNRKYYRGVELARIKHVHQVTEILECTFGKPSLFHDPHFDKQALCPNLHS